MTVNSSLTLRPNAFGWAKRMWWASAGTVPQRTQGCAATWRRWSLSRRRRGSPRGEGALVDPVAKLDGPDAPEPGPVDQRLWRPGIGRSGLKERRRCWGRGLAGAAYLREIKSRVEAPCRRKRKRKPPQSGAGPRRLGKPSPSFWGELGVVAKVRNAKVASGVSPRPTSKRQRTSTQAHRPSRSKSQIPSGEVERSRWDHGSCWTCRFGISAGPTGRAMSTENACGLRG